MRMGIVSLLLSFVALAYARNKLIIVGMSGLRHDYVEKPSLPAFHLFRTTGFRAKRMEIPMVTNSWTSLWTIATGLWPEEHGIIDDKMYDPTIDEPFTAGVSRVNSQWMPYQPVWLAAEDDGVKTAVSGWPGAELKYGRLRASNYHPFVSRETEIQTEARIDQFSSWMYDGADLGLILFPEPDNTGHKFGAESDEVNEVMKQNDRLLDHLLQVLDKLGIEETTNIIIVGDHGMTDHHSQQVIYLSEYNVRLGDLRWYTGNLFTTGMLLPHPDRVNSTYEKLKAASAKLTVYRREELPDRFHMKNHRRTPPIVIVPNKGYRIELTKPHTNNELPDQLLGMHGYDSDITDMMPAMLARGPDFDIKELETIKSIDIYPMVCSMLKLTRCHGSDGTLAPARTFVTRVELKDNRAKKLNYTKLNTGPLKKLVRKTRPPISQSSAPTAHSLCSIIFTFTAIILLH